MTRKQQNPYLIRKVVLASGERFPVLLERATGLPLYKPTLYALTRLRTKNRASETIGQCSLAVMVLMRFLKDHGIDLDERMARGRLFTLSEIETLVRYCRTLVHDLEQLKPKPPPTRTAKVSSLERARMRKQGKATSRELKSGSSGTRGLYIANYLQWLVELRATDAIVKPHPELAAAAALSIGALREHLPSKHGHSISDRKGFTKATREQILEIVSPSSPENPWPEPHCKYRNELIVKWLLHLGIRRGEFLGIRISDVDFQRNEVTIHRRADDAEYPKADEPNTKTYARLLPLSDEMASLARNYILKHRGQLKGARKHKYLLVASGTGAPLGKAAFAKIFLGIRGKLDNGAKVHAHLFRHTWNDDFSEQMDREKIPEDRERKVRSVLMGWSPTSGTAATYTKRHVERKAREASLAMQRKYVKEKKQ
jgi:integrase